MKTLNATFEDLETDWRLLQQMWQPDILQRFYSRLQAFANDEAVMQIETLQSALQPLKVSLMQLLNRGEPANYAERSIVENQLSQIAEALRLLSNQPTSDTVQSESEVSAVIGKAFLLIADSSFRQFLVGQLDKQGFRTRGFQQKDKLFKAVIEAQPDVVIMDLLFRDNRQTAPQIARELNKQYGIPIIFISDRTDIAARILAVRAGGHHFFSKPVDVHGLSLAVKELCEVDSPPDWEILLVDDTGKYTNKYARALIGNGMSVRILTDPMRILSALLKYEPNLALINHQMLGVNTLELVTALRQQERYSHLPIILFSEQFSEEAQDAAVRGIADDFICEPMSPSQLLATVKNRLLNAREYDSVIDITRRDILTGLFNYYYLMHQLEVPSHDEDTPAALLYLHHDGLQGSGPLLTFEMVSAIVRDTARHLQQCAIVTDVPVRLHDSAFVLLSRDRTLEDLQALAEQLREALETRVIEVAGREILCTCSIGISLLETGPNAPQQSLFNAEQACLEARQQGGNSVHLHCSVETARQRQAVYVHWQREITAALGERRLYLAYQPVAALHEENTTEYYDVLLRLHQASGEPVLPSTFMQSAEKSGLIIEIDHWVLENAVLNLELKYSLNEPVNFFVRLSIQSISSPDFIAWLQEIITHATVPPAAFIFDVSQTHIDSHAKQLVAFVNAIKRLGCRFALRDFDGSNAAVKKLERLPVDFVKICNTLVQGVLTNPENLTEIQRISDQAHQRETAVVAPFVEDAQVLQKLWLQRVDYVAGHLLQAPSQDMIYEFDL